MLLLLLAGHYTTAAGWPQVARLNALWGTITRPLLGFTTLLVYCRCVLVVVVNVVAAVVAMWGWLAISV